MSQISVDSPLERTDSDLTEKEETSEKKSNDKVTLLFLATGNAPILKKKKFAISSTSTFKEVIKFLREKVLKLKPSDTLVPLFLTKNSFYIVILHFVRIQMKL